MGYFTNGVLFLVNIEEMIAEISCSYHNIEDKHTCMIWNVQNARFTTGYQSGLSGAILLVRVLLVVTTEDGGLPKYVGATKTTRISGPEGSKATKLSLPSLYLVCQSQFPVSDWWLFLLSSLLLVTIKDG